MVEEVIIERGLRLPDQLNRKLKQLARQDDRSANAYIIHVLRGHVETIEAKAEEQALARSFMLQ